MERKGDIQWKIFWPKGGNLAEGDTVGIDAELLRYSRLKASDGAGQVVLTRASSPSFNAGAARPVVAHAPLPAFGRRLSSPYPHHASSA